MGVGGVLTKRPKMNMSGARPTGEFENEGLGVQNSVYGKLGPLCCNLGGGGYAPLPLVAVEDGAPGSATEGSQESGTRVP